MGKNGSDVLLLVNTGTPEVPVYEAVGSQRGYSQQETTAVIDVSSKDSRTTRVLPGRYGSTMSLGALYVPTNAAYLALQSAMRDGALIKVMVEDDGVTTEQADAVVTSMSEEFPDQAAATLSVELTIDGEWSEVGS